MELQRAHDQTNPTRRAKRVLSSKRPIVAAAKKTNPARQVKLETLLEELADLIESEHGILIP